MKRKCTVEESETCSCSISISVAPHREAPSSKRSSLWRAASIVRLNAYYLLPILFHRRGVVAGIIFGIIRAVRPPLGRVETIVRVPPIFWKRKKKHRDDASRDKRIHFTAVRRDDEFMEKFDHRFVTSRRDGPRRYLISRMRLKHFGTFPIASSSFKSLYYIHYNAITCEVYFEESFEVLG